MDGDCPLHRKWPKGAVGPQHNLQIFVVKNPNLEWPVQNSLDFVKNPNLYQFYRGFT